MLCLAPSSDRPCFLLRQYRIITVRHAKTKRDLKNRIITSFLTLRETHFEYENNQKSTRNVNETYIVNRCLCKS